MAEPRTSAGTARIAVLIPAAGEGKRLGAPGSKALLPLGGQPLLRHTLRVFQAHAQVERIGVIVRAQDEAALDAALPTGADRAKLLPWIRGGAERQDSVYCGLEALRADPPDWVLVHDGARPFCSEALLGRVLAALAEHAAVIPVLPVTDTVRRCVDGQSEVIDRAHLFRTQTPQGFHWAPLLEAHAAARQAGRRATDDAQLVEWQGGRVAMVPGDAQNLKVTTATDYRYGEWWLREGARTVAGETM